MDKIKYVHLQVEKDGKKIVYTIYDEYGNINYKLKCNKLSF